MAEKPDQKGITIISEPSEMKAFLNFPYDHYKNDQNWIPPLYIQQRDLLDPDKNPFFNEVDHALFLAEINGKPAGRIGAFVNHPYNEYHKTECGHFGFFECIEDETVAKLLVNAAAQWFRDKGMKEMMGPVNPGFMYEIGSLIEGHDKEPYVMMPWNKSYYDDLYKKSGLDKEMDLFAYMVTSDTVALDRINKADKIVRHRLPKLSIREVNLKDFDREAKIIREIFNAAWATNWGFSPVSESEFNHIAKDLKQIIDTDIAHIAEDDGRPVGFSVALPNLNQALKHVNRGRLLPFGFLKLLWHKRKINSIRTALMGVIPEYRGKGIDALLHREAIIKGLDKGYNASELSWLLETNTEMIRVAEKIGGHRDKTYRIYSKKL